jgi:hypothetical protein
MCCRFLSVLFGRVGGAGFAADIFLRAFFGEAFVASGQPMPVPITC